MSSPIEDQAAISHSSPSLRYPGVTLRVVSVTLIASFALFLVSSYLAKDVGLGNLEGAAASSQSFGRLIVLNCITAFLAWLLIFKATKVEQIELTFPTWLWPGIVGGAGALTGVLAVTPSMGGDGAADYFDTVSSIFMHNTSNLGISVLLVSQIMLFLLALSYYRPLWEREKTNESEPIKRVTKYENLLLFFCLSVTVGALYLGLESSKITSGNIIYLLVASVVFFWIGYFLWLRAIGRVNTSWSPVIFSTCVTFFPVFISESAIPAVFIICLIVAFLFEGVFGPRRSTTRGSG